MNNDHMNNESNIFSQNSSAEIEKIRAAIDALKEEKVLLLESGNQLEVSKLHPIDRDQLKYNLTSFLKETKLRKRELEVLIYAKWLQEKREEAIQGIINSNQNSPAHLLYEFVLPVLREELDDIERGTKEADKESLKPNVMKLVMDGKLDIALELLFTYSSQNAPDHQNEIIHLTSGYRHYESQERKGLLTHDVVSSARAKILDKIIQLTDAIIS